MHMRDITPGYVERKLRCVSQKQAVFIIVNVHVWHKFHCYNLKFSAGSVNVTYTTHDTTNIKKYINKTNLELRSKSGR